MRDKVFDCIHLSCYHFVPIMLCIWLELLFMIFVDWLSIFVHEISAPLSSEQRVMCVQFILLWFWVGAVENFWLDDFREFVGFFVGFILTNRHVLKPAKMKIAKRRDTIMTSASRSTIMAHRNPCIMRLWLMWRRICVASRKLAKTNWIWLGGLGRPLWLVLTEVMLKCAIANEWTSTTKIQLMVNKQKSIAERESLTPPALESITLRARANKWTEAVYINYANVRCRAISMNICNYEHNFVIDV